MKNNIFSMLIIILIIWIISFVIATVAFNTNLGEGKVAVIPVKGFLSLESSSTPLKAVTSGSEIAAKIKEANENDNIKAIVLDINSGGGTVLGSKVIADTLENVEKPVVAYISESGASGAYWVAAKSDYIYADELSLVGSISVLSSQLEFSGFLNDFNITYNGLKTGQYKDIGSPLKEMTEEEEELLMQRLNTIHNYFVNEVAEGRNMTFEEVAELSDGLFYLGLEAKEIGLVDELGNRDNAISKAKELAGLTNGEIKEYGEKSGFLNSLKQYTTFSSFYIGQGIGSVLVQNSEFQIIT